MTDRPFTCHLADLLIFGPEDIEPMEQDDEDLHGIGLSMEEI